MTSWNITDGVNAELINGLPSGVDNDQGTIRGGGNVSTTDKFSADALTLGLNTDRYVTIVSGVNGIDPVNGSAGWVFNGGDQVIVRVTNDIAGVANTVLLGGDSNSASRSTIHQKDVVSTHYYKTAVRQGNWNEYSGVFDPAVTVSDGGGWDIAGNVDNSSNLVASGVDNAANPTAAVPGELVYRDGSPTPVQDEYQPKTLF